MEFERFSDDTLIIELLLDIRDETKSIRAFLEDDDDGEEEVAEADP